MNLGLPILMTMVFMRQRTRLCVPLPMSLHEHPPLPDLDRRLILSCRLLLRLQNQARSLV
jgi:hypothetical protein